MRCLRCGKEAAPNSAYCASCGKKASPNQKSPEKPERKDQDLYDEDGVLTFDPKKENYHEREDEDESNEKYFSERDRAYHRQMEEKRLKRVIMVDPKNPGKDIYVPDSLIASIIFTILCCQPLGLVAVYYAIQCNRYIAMGDKMNALHASKRARFWIILTIVVSVALMFLAGEIGKNKEKEAQPSPVQQETVAENQEAEAPETPETPAEPEEGTVMPEDEGIWTVDLDRAKKAAQEKGLKLMILFTGSDWCHWCKLLEGEIFSQEAFQKEAVDIVLPVKLDFPSKVKFPEAVRKKYEAEMKRYGIRGFPTVVLADPDGSAFAVCGYQQGGEQAYLEMLKALLADKKALEAKVAELKDGGADAARELFNVLEEYSAKFSHTPCVKEGLKKYYDICKEKDPEISQTLEREEKIKERLAGIAEQHQIGEGYDPSQATKEIADQAAADYESLINEFSIEGEKKQEILQKAAIAYLIVRDEEKAEEYLDKAVEAAPDTDFAKMIQARKRAKEEEQENNNNQ